MTPYRPRRAYLDHAATTPVLPEVITTVATQMAVLGNASSLHGSGRAARQVVEESRERIAAALGARPSEIIFTAGGTEADNLAIKGLYWSRQTPPRRRILATAIEHHAVLDPVTWLGESAGADVEWLPVDGSGRVRLDVLRASIERDPESVALVSCMWANNEVGTVQPVREVVELCDPYGIPVHSDAVQAVGNLPLDFAVSGVGAMAISGHKVGGPLGIGALLLDRGLSPVPLLHGGLQERVRSGTLDVPAIAGFAQAVESAVNAQPVRSTYLKSLRDALISGVQSVVPEVTCNGCRSERLPGNAHLSFPGCEGDALLMLLDAQGVECSTGSACSAGVPEPSHVLLAMGLSIDVARSSLRFSLGHTSTMADVDALLDVLLPVVERARAAGLVTTLRGR